MNLFKIGLAITLFSPLLAFAGAGHVGGGHGIQCSDGSVQTLDFYEATALNSFSLDFGNAKDLSSALNMVVSRLRAVDPIRAAELDSGLSQFNSNAQFIHGQKLNFTEDANTILVPAGCSVVQIILRLDDSKPLQKKYLVDGDLWNQLDFKSQAMLMTHELFYQGMLKQNPNDASNARYYNGLVWSSQFSNFSEIQNFYIAAGVVKFDTSYLQGCKDLGDGGIYNGIGTFSLESQVAGERCKINFGGYSWNASQIVITMNHVLELGTMASLSQSGSNPPALGTVALAGNQIDATRVRFDDMGKATDMYAMPNFSGPFTTDDGSTMSCPSVWNNTTHFAVSKSGNVISCELSN